MQYGIQNSVNTASKLYPGVRASAYKGRSRIALRRGFRQALGRFTLFSVSVLCLGILYGSWQVRLIALRLPRVVDLHPRLQGRAITILSSDGVLLATLRSEERRPIALSHITPAMIDATLAIEDARFYQHGSIDPRGIVRALWSDLTGADKTAQGASTLTQQLARCLYLSGQKTVRRKIEETILAERIERKYSKSQILEAYLNTIYYGEGAYGVDSAARTYFGRSARDLTMGQAALLAGIPQRPTAFAPTYHLTAAIHRRDEVLARMIATGKITSGQADAARRQPLRLLKRNALGSCGWRAPYFVAHVIRLLRDVYGGDLPSTGARVETTLNWGMQRAAERALRNGLRNGIANTGAVVAIEPTTGAVRALVGGPDFLRDQFDAALQGVRQPGSAFKPLVYATAFDTETCTLTTRVEDEPIVYPSALGSYVVHNYDRTYRGQVSVLQALRASINTVAVRVADEAGIDRVASYAHLLGIDTPLTPDLPLALGASGVHPISLCSAYTAFANNGARYDPAFIARIVASDGTILFQDSPQSRYHADFLSPKTLDQINVALREVVLHGTGMAAGLPDAHGKTGTSSSHRDAWFVGYTGELAAAVWVGDVQRGPLRYLPMNAATGGSLCAPIWRNFMAPAIAIEARIAITHRERLRTVSEPSKDALCLRLDGEQQALAGNNPENGNPTGSNGASPVQVVPTGFQPAQDGSGPIVVAVPERTSEDRQANGSPGSESSTPPAPSVDRPSDTQASPADPTAGR